MVPVLEEATESKRDEFEYSFQDKSGGEEIVAVLEGEIQGLQRNRRRCRVSMHESVCIFDEGPSAEREHKIL